MEIQEMIDLISQIENKEVLSRIAHQAMIRVCMLERSMEIESEIIFKKEGVKSKMDFEVEIIETEKGGDA